MKQSFLIFTASLEAPRERRRLVGVSFVMPTRRRRSQGGFALLGLDHGHALGSRQRPTFTGLR